MRLWKLLLNFAQHATHLARIEARCQPFAAPQPLPRLYVLVDVELTGSNVPDDERQVERIVDGDRSELVWVVDKLLRRVAGGFSPNTSRSSSDRAKLLVRTTRDNQRVLYIENLLLQ